MNLFAVSTHKEHSTMAKIATTNLLELHYEAIKYYYTNFQYRVVFSILLIF